MRFEWHDAKAEKNWRKHGVRFSDAVGVFLDPDAVEFVDEEHSTKDETRFAIIGFGPTGLLYVVFTETQPGLIRIVHARRADKGMVKIYEAG